MCSRSATHPGRPQRHAGPTLSRADQPAAERRDFFLYVDEAHLVATHTMVALFPEARKFHLGVTLAHPYLDQLTEELRAALLGNVGTVAPEHTSEVGSVLDVERATLDTRPQA